MDVLKDVDSNPRNITFETDRFSAYVIGYSDEAEDNETKVTVRFSSHMF